MQTTGAGARVYAWPIGRYQPVSSGECSQLAASLGSRVGFDFTVDPSEPTGLPGVPQCAGDLDGMTTSLSSASAAAENLCGALGWLLARAGLAGHTKI
jgi:hypothetical protein